MEVDNKPIRIAVLVKYVNPEEPECHMELHPENQDALRPYLWEEVCFLMTTPQPEVSAGDLVIVEKTDLPPSRWNRETGYEFTDKEVLWRVVEEL